MVRRKKNEIVRFCSLYGVHFHSVCHLYWEVCIVDEMGMNILYALLYLFLAPVGGGLLAGLDRKLAARMQRRVGPPVVQPFYDVLKLFEKERIAVNEAQGFLFGRLPVFHDFVRHILFCAGRYPSCHFHTHHGGHLPCGGVLFIIVTLQPDGGGTGTSSDYGV